MFACPVYCISANGATAIAVERTGRFGAPPFKKHRFYGATLAVELFPAVALSVFCTVKSPQGGPPQSIAEDTPPKKNAGLEVRRANAL